MIPTWYRCTRTMPADNTTDLIIAHSETEGYQAVTGTLMRNLFAFITINKGQVNPDWRWTPYTDELWSELNKS